MKIFSGKKFCPRKKNKIKRLNTYGTSGLFFTDGEPKFRAEQVFNWMYNHLADDFAEMKNLLKICVHH